MKNLNSTSIKIGLASALTLAIPALAHAADDYSSTNIETASGPYAVGFAGTILVFVLIMAAIGIGFLIFWIIMLVDAFKRTNWQDDSQKTTWLVILIASIFVGLSWLAAILYYFIVKKALDNGSAKPANKTTAPPAKK